MTTSQPDPGSGLPNGAKGGDNNENVLSPRSTPNQEPSSSASMENPTAPTPTVPGQDHEYNSQPSSADQTTSPPAPDPDPGAANSNLRQRHLGVGEIDNSNHIPGPAQDDALPVPLLQAQEEGHGHAHPRRRSRRLRRDTEELLSIITANPFTCLCIFLTSLVVVVGFGYFLFELHLAYKYSTIIHKLHVSSSKTGYGEPSRFSSQQKRTKIPTKSPSSSTPSFDDPSDLAPKQLPMLDAETEMYANQLQSVLKSLKRTIDRIDPTTNSTTFVAGLVELKPLESSNVNDKETRFTTELKSENVEEKVENLVLEGADDELELLELLKKGFGVDKTPDDGQPDPEKPKYPDYIRELKQSVQDESRKAQDNLNDWMEKHRDDYPDEAEWNAAVAAKKAKDDDYNSFLDAMLYVTEELENDYSESSTGTGSVHDVDDDSISLKKLMEIFEKSAVQQGQEYNEQDGFSSKSASDVSRDNTDKKIVITEVTPEGGNDNKDDAAATSSTGSEDEDDDWLYSNWDDENDGDFYEKTEREAEPQFA